MITPIWLNIERTHDPPIVHSYLITKTNALGTKKMVLMESLMYLAKILHHLSDNQNVL
jgi:hypothetical protein